MYYNFAMDMLVHHFVSDKTFNEARVLFGEKALVDLIGSAISRCCGFVSTAPKSICRLIESRHLRKSGDIRKRRESTVHLQQAIVCVAMASLMCHPAADAQERTKHAFGVFEHQPTGTGILIAAPHGTFDAHTALIAVETARQLSAGYVTAQRFEVGQVRINVNRPTEGANLSCAREVRSDRAREVYAAYRGVVNAAAAGKPLRLYVEIHGNSRVESSGHIELATTGVSTDEARRIKDAYAAGSVRVRKNVPDFPDIALLIEPVDRVYFTASCTKREGALAGEVASRTLHFELPRSAREPSARDAVSMIIADIVRTLAP